MMNRLLPNRSLTLPSHATTSSTMATEDSATKPPELIASNQYVKEDDNNNNSNILVFNPHKKVNPTRDLDALLAKELNQLSLQEREQVYQELHGVVSVVEEGGVDTPWVQHKLSEFDKALYELPSSSTIAYRQAHVQNVGHATDPSFRLQFLRAERFDAPTAAARMARYFREKLVLFGPEKVGQARITLADLNEEDVKVLESGYMQWLPARDQSGRPIYFGPLLLRAFTARETVLRAMWYFLNAAIQDDVETQKRGIVILSYMMGHSPRLDMDEHDRHAGWHICVLLGTIPVRVEGVHICCSKKSTLFSINLMLFVTGRNLRIRTRCHCGTPIEVDYALMSFGIPAHMIPALESGEDFDLQPHAAWMEMRHQQDSRYLLEHSNNSGGYDHDNKKKIAIVAPETEEESSLTGASSAIAGYPGTDTPTMIPNGSSTGSGGGYESDVSTTTSSLQEQHHPKRQLGQGSDVTPSPFASVSLSFPRPIIQEDLVQDDNDDLAGNVNNGTMLIIVPSPMDVFFGKLKVTQTQMGNALYKRLVDSHREEYEGSTKLGKMNIAKDIIQRIKAGGGRFLKQKSAPKQKRTATANEGGGGAEGGGGDDSAPPPPKRIRRRGNQIDEDASCVGWVEVPDQVVREKIGHSFRNLRARAPISSSSPSPSSSSVGGSSSGAYQPPSSTSSTTNSGLVPEPSHGNFSALSVGAGGGGKGYCLWGNNNNDGGGGEGGVRDSDCWSTLTRSPSPGSQPFQ